MAKVTITITLEDVGDTGRVEADVNLDPPLRKNEDGEFVATAAQQDAFDMLGTVFTADNLIGIDSE